ncbi:hypothetical protein L3Q82_018377 [Scortum barcoo]|uniref:Uncharacterized protein n=1 Tax=Scortum barcoo TaxID=214431 RepID=A0ACB8VIR2_9TELE|nr:hypothetical protein L3Q82_018377 [Scortum barcoo]
MSGAVQQSLFFLGLPDLKKLCCVDLTLQEDEEPRNKQIKTCRELVLLYSDILASPALDSFTEITVVMAIPFFQKGFLQMFAQRRSLQLGSPRCVFPGILQCCLSYSLITRLAPGWNKAGLYLVTGKDFLTQRERLNAVSMELSTTEGRLSISIEASSVRLPPATLQDFDLSPFVLRRFCSDPDSVLDPSSTGGAIWCHILPSMKKGQIITISRQLPREGPFKTYRDLQTHWNHLYGYRLPDLAEEEVVYCSVYFRPVGDRLFTYPLSCIRLQPVQRCPWVDLQGALGSFLSDIRARLQTVCGFPACLSSKPCYRTVDLNTAATVQVMSGEQVNLTSFSSIRPVLTQLPPPPPPRPVKPSCRPASSLASSSSSLLAPKLVPVFKNKCPSHFVNVALLCVHKQKEQLSGGGEEKRRVTLPAFRKKTLSSSSLSSSSVSSLSSITTLPPPVVPRFRPHSGAAPQPAGRPKVRHLPSLSPKSKPGFIPAAKLEIRFKSRSDPKTNTKKAKPERQTISSCEEQAEATKPPEPTSSDSSNKETSSSSRGVVFESKPKKSRVRDVDVEQMARSNQARLRAVHKPIMNRRTSRTVTSPGLALQGPHPGARPGVGASRHERLVAGVFAHRTRPGSAQLEMAAWARLPVGSPPAGRYRLEIVGLASTCIAWALEPSSLRGAGPSTTLELPRVRMVAASWCGLAYSSPAQPPCVGVHSGEREVASPAAFGLGMRRRKLDRPGRPKAYCEGLLGTRLAEPSVREVFNSHLRKSFSQIPREAGDIESEWTMFSASIVDAAMVRSCGRLRSLVPVVAATPNPVVDTGSTGRPSKPQPGTVLEAKTRVWEEFGEAMERGLSVGLEENSGKLANRPAPQKGEAVLCQHCLQCRWGAVDLDWGHCRTVEERYFEDLLNPTDLPSNEEAEAGVSEVDSSITQAEVTEVVRKLLRWQGAGGG